MFVWATLGMILVLGAADNDGWFDGSAVGSGVGAGVASEMISIALIFGGFQEKNGR